METVLESERTVNRAFAKELEILKEKLGKNENDHK